MTVPLCCDGADVGFDETELDRAGLAGGAGVVLLGTAVVVTFIGTAGGAWVGGCTLDAEA